MKKIMNITDYPEDLSRYQGREGLEASLLEFGLDGLEVLPSGKEPLYPFPKGRVLGVHMRCRPDWLDFWNRDYEALNREYGSEEAWRAEFRGDVREELLLRAREDLDYACAKGAEYVVFHVSNVRATDILTQSFSYSDEAVTAAAAEFINELLKGREPSFYFLAENLWWPGMRMTNVGVTERFLEWVSYPKKGIVLDMGHFLHTNPALRSQKEAVAYLERMLKEHERLLPAIRGVHLHQTLSGAYAQDFLKRKQDVAAPYPERFSRAMEYVLQVDRHEPFTDAGVLSLLEKIRPAYLIFEFLSRDRQEYEEKLRRQMRVFKTIY